MTKIRAGSCQLPYSTIIMTRVMIHTAMHHGIIIGLHSKLQQIHKSDPACLTESQSFESITLVLFISLTFLFGNS